MKYTQGRVGRIFVVKFDHHDVLVEKVAPDSRAWRNNLREGDLIVAANSGEFRDLAGFRDTLADEPRQLVLQVSRRGRIGNLMME